MTTETDAELYERLGPHRLEEFEIHVSSEVLELSRVVDFWARVMGFRYEVFCRLSFGRLGEAEWIRRKTKDQFIQASRMWTACPQETVDHLKKRLSA
jgi:hypothetical protein